jgi:RNA 2',3'-cyclic 3'-phosphodiesterase
VRLFFALWPDAEVRRQLAEVAAQLTLSSSSPLVPSANYHLTVAFLGEVERARVAPLREIGAAQRVPCFTVVLDAAEFWARPKIIVTAAQNIPHGLQSLWARLREDMALHHFADSVAGPQLCAPLRAHVTLARKVAQAPVLQAMSPLTWSVNSFSLICSETGGIHSAYTVVDTWPLLYTGQNP